MLSEDINIDSVHGKEHERNKTCQVWIQALLRLDLANAFDLYHPLDHTDLL